jgi:WD40 repeat protein
MTSFRSDELQRKVAMWVFHRAMTSAGRAPRAGFLGIECLRELCLICGGIAVVMGLLNQADSTDTESLTASMKAGAASEAQPSHPVYQLRLQEDETTVWVRRGKASIVQISLEDGDVLARIPVSGACVATSDHSRDGRVHACSTVPGGVIISRDGATLIEEPPFNATASIFCLGVAPDGSQVAAIDDRRGILIWDLTGDRPTMRCVSPGFSAVGIAWSHDSDRLLVGGDNSRLSLLSADGKALWHLNRGLERITALAWSPDGSRIAVGLQGGDLAVLRSQDGGILWRSCRDVVQVSTISFAPDGQRIAVGGFDRTVDVVSAADGKLLVTMPGHYDMVRSLQFLPDGDRILSGSLDGTLRIWSASAGRELQKM